MKQILQISNTTITKIFKYWYLLVVLVFIGSISARSVYASASSGPNSPGTAGVSSSVGAVTWSNTSNSLSSNNSYSTSDLTSFSIQDQWSFGLGDTYTALGGSDYSEVGQTFIADGGKLSHVIWDITRSGFPNGDLEACIYNASSGIPTGLALACSSTIVSTNSVSATPNYQETTFYFNNDNLHLISGRRYVISLNIFNHSGSAQIRVSLDSGGGHSGNPSRTSGGGWSSYSGDLTFELYTINNTSYYLTNTNYGFSIPTTAAINGIVAEVERKSTSNGYESAVSIRKADGSIGSTNKSTGASLPSSDAYITYGGSSDLWGESWTPANINDTDFGIAFSASGSGTISVDHSRITVYYTDVPTITSPTKTSIIGSSATLGGNVTSDGGGTITGRGVCVGASADPTLGGNCFSTTGTTGTFTVSATGLIAGTLYHYRAYATNSIGTSYTTDDTFTTLALDNYQVNIASPQTAGVCSTGTNTVTARDSTNATITTDSSTVNMTSTGAGVTFYTTDTCSTSTTQYTLSSGVANIYYKTNVAQNFTITATKASSTETGTSSSITVNPGAHSRLVITLPSQEFSGGSGSLGSAANQRVSQEFAISKITATDDYFNIVTTYSGSKTLVYAGPSSAGGAPSYTTSVDFTSGESTTPLLTTLYFPETTTITVTDGGSYGYASSPFIVTLPSVTVKKGVIFRSGTTIQSQ